MRDPQPTMQRRTLLSTALALSLPTTAMKSIWETN